MRTPPLTEEQVREIRAAQEARPGWRYREPYRGAFVEQLSMRLGIARSRIYGVLSGKSYRHVQ